MRSFGIAAGLLLVAGIAAVAGPGDAIETPRATGTEPAEFKAEILVTAEGQVLNAGAEVDWEGLAAYLEVPLRLRGPIRVTADRRADFSVVRAVSFFCAEASPPGPPVWSVSREDGEALDHSPAFKGWLNWFAKATKLRVYSEGTETRVAAEGDPLGPLPPWGETRDLREVLEELKDWGESEVVLIDTEDGVTFEEVLRLDSICRKAGFTEIRHVRHALPLEEPPARPEDDEGEPVPLELATSTLLTEKEPAGVAVFTVTADRRVFGADIEAAPDFLPRLLGDQVGKDQALVLAADRRALWKDVNEVIRAATLAGVPKILWAVKAKAGRATIPFPLKAAAPPEGVEPVRVVVTLRRRVGGEKSRLFVSTGELGSLEGGLKKLEPTLKEWRIKGRPLHVTLDAWDAAPFADVLRVVEALRQEGAERITLRPPAPR